MYLAQGSKYQKAIHLQLFKFQIILSNYQLKLHSSTIVFQKK